MKIAAGVNDLVSASNAQVFLHPLEKLFNLYFQTTFRAVIWARTIVLKVQLLFNIQKSLFFKGDIIASYLISQKGVK